jgi:hypothetical protein
MFSDTRGHADTVEQLVVRIPFAGSHSIDRSLGATHRLTSFDFSSRKNAHYQQRCGEIGKLGVAIQENFGELQRTGHPKWKEVDLNQDLGGWNRDACAQMVRRVSLQKAPQTPEDLLKAITDILKGKGPPR